MNKIYAKMCAIPKCDICSKEAMYDAKIPHSSWANLCKEHFVGFGCKLGIGLGQAFVVEFDILSEASKQEAINNIRSNIADEEGYCDMSDEEIKQYIYEGNRTFFTDGEVCS